MKICVYAICKNESKFLERWMNSLVDEADYIAVLDTGSTDASYDILDNYSCNSLFSKDWNHKAKIICDQIDIQKELGIMRFDIARNKSKALVPIDADICFNIDIDQIPVKGWSDIIMERFRQGYNEVRGDIVDHDENGVELNRWYSRNVYPNSPYWIWKRVIHEVIDYFGPDEVKSVYDKRFIIDHYPDPHKDRSLYTELLYYSCKEFPKDPYYGIHLGIDLSRRGQKQEAAEAFRRCLSECDFTDNLDIEFQTYLNLASTTDDFKEAITSINNAKSLGIETRRLYVTCADIYEAEEDYDRAIISLEEALTKVKSYSSDWTDDAKNFSGYIEDRLSLFYFYRKHDYLKSIEYCSKALQLDPDNTRINNNLKFYYKSYIESRGI